jgi:hypothetical protein
MTHLPAIINEIERKAAEILEPTIYERREVMGIIRDYIREKERKVYGGSAINETLKNVNPKDAIYDEYTYTDIEFYSPTPVSDLVELTNILYNKGKKYVIAREAVHEETYSIYVNFRQYCDITYVPTRVYVGIKTLKIDGINYVHPHFILIDQLRIINQPLTAASQRWEKTFNRMYMLLKNYPLEYYDKPLKIPPPENEIQEHISKIKEDFMIMEGVIKTCLIGGFDAYNFYILHAMDDINVKNQAMGDNNVENQAQVVNDKEKQKLKKFLTNVPYIEIVSVNYRDTVEKLYYFVRNNVTDPKLISLEEYFPLFQFNDYSVFINYNGIPIARVLKSDGYCVPNNKTEKGYMYVSFQYLLMSMFINKFRAYLDKDKEMYFRYSIAISNLVAARNIFLTRNKLGVLNNTVFGEFKMSCVGTTMSYLREGHLKSFERFKKGKTLFRYMPEQFYELSPEDQKKFDPSKHCFKNTSGNKILNPKNLLFKLDKEGNIIKDDESENECMEKTINEKNEQ